MYDKLLHAALLLILGVVVGYGLGFENAAAACGIVASLVSAGAVGEDLAGCSRDELISELHIGG